MEQVRNQKHWGQTERVFMQVQEALLLIRSRHARYCNGDQLRAFRQLADS